MDRRPAKYGGGFWSLILVFWCSLLRSNRRTSIAYAERKILTNSKMDGTKRKRKSFEFAEGHKRETRKSYQSFIESTGKSSSAVLGNVALSQIKSEEMTDDGVRKSSRKPVPKKSFDLVDTFEEKSPLSKHIMNIKQKSGSSAQINPHEYEVIHIKEEPLIDDYDSAPRKSSRVPVPKKSFDLIDPNLKARAAVNQQDNSKTDAQIKTQKKTKKSNAEKANVVSCEADGKDVGEKSKRTQYGKGSNKIDIPPQILPDVQKQDYEKKERSKFTLKLDFKAKKDKRSRKRKLDILTDQSPSNVRREGPSEKIAKVVECDNTKVIEDNIEKSALVEALQALKQPPQTSLVEEIDYPHLEKKSALIGSEDKISQSGSKKTPAKVKRRAADNRNTPLHAENANEEEKGTQANIGRAFSTSLEKGWDYSRSTTEISDGHVILKLEGLHTPTKTKKHRKKHKNVHQKIEITNEESKNAEPENSPEADVNVIVTNQDSQYEKSLPIEKEISSNESTFPSEVKEKKTKSHKKKRKLSQSNLLDSPKNVIVGTAAEDNELTVKKRKIYKKKKGEKILVRIQTEFWNKNGDLVKVEPMNIKENKPTEAKEKGVVKQKKSQDLSMNAAMTEKMSSIQSMKNSASNTTSMELKQGARRDQVSKSSSKKRESIPPISDIDYVKTGSPKSSQNKTKLSSDTNKGTNSTIKKKKERKIQTLTAYLLFCRKYRPQVVFENPYIGMYLFECCLEIDSESKKYIIEIVGSEC